MRAERLSKAGYTLSGRDALEEYGLCSGDEAITFIETDAAEGLCAPICYVSTSSETQVIDGKRVALLPKAMIDFMLYPYDVSGVLEALDSCTDEELQSIYAYACKEDLDGLLQDSKWVEYFSD